ncbi:MAG: hypothetical protein QE272_05745 [Nevskia sp.]|nr:hypothetical protein [Nevskia sp.]
MDHGKKEKGRILPKGRGKDDFKSHIHAHSFRGRVMQNLSFNPMPTVNLSKKEQAEFQSTSNNNNLNRNAKEATAEWLAGQLTDQCCMVTITLKKFLPKDIPGLIPEFMNRDQGKRLLRNLRKRFFRSVYKTAYRRKKVTPAFFACYEEGADNKQPHVHVIFDIPSGKTIDEATCELIRCFGLNSRWILPNIDAIPVYDKKGILGYIMKTGLDSVIF